MRQETIPIHTLISNITRLEHLWLAYQLGSVNVFLFFGLFRVKCENRWCAGIVPTQSGETNNSHDLTKRDGRDTVHENTGGLLMVAYAILSPTGLTSDFKPRYV